MSLKLDILADSSESFLLNILNDTVVCNTCNKILL